MARKRVVQTELVDEEYQLLQRVAAIRGVTIKHSLREAVQQWVSTQIPIAEDPLFKIPPIKTGVKTDSSKLDKLLYGEGSR